MMRGFQELAIGGVLVTPFVGYVAAAAVIMALLRPLLRRIGFEPAFAHPPLAALCLFIVILGSLIALTQGVPL